MADILHTMVGKFRKMLVSWMYENQSDEHMIEKWLAVRGLDLETYAVHLMSGGTSDGLELWCFSHATDIPVTVIMESTVISTASAGIDLSQITFLLDTYNTGYLCVASEDDDMLQQEPTCQLTPEMTGNHTCSCPVTETQAQQDLDDGSMTSTAGDSKLDTDIEDLMESKTVVQKQHLPVSGVPKERICPVCSQQLVLGLALERHLKSLHLLSQSFDCKKCGSRFNNPREVTSHRANIHNPRKVSCKQCMYRV